jgi:hypothetical protein
MITPSSTVTSSFLTDLSALLKKYSSDIIPAELRIEYVEVNDDEDFVDEEHITVYIPALHDENNHILRAYTEIDLGRTFTHHS